MTISQIRRQSTPGAARRASFETARDRGRKIRGEMNKNPLGELVPSATLDGEHKNARHPEVGMIFSTSLPRFKAFLEAFPAKARIGPARCYLSPLFFCPRAKTFCRRCRAFHPPRYPRCWLAAPLARRLDGTGCSSRCCSEPTAPCCPRPRRPPAHSRHRLHHAWSAGPTHAEHLLVPQYPETPQQVQSPPEEVPPPLPEHCFVFALLLTPNGLRIPYWLPFYIPSSIVPSSDASTTRRQTWQRQVIDCLPLAAHMVVVVGDTAFEAKQVRRACAPALAVGSAAQPRAACLAGKQGQRPKVRSLYGQLNAQDFLPGGLLRLDQGELAALARVSPASDPSLANTNAPTGCITGQQRSTTGAKSLCCSRPRPIPRHQAA